ncbi:MAG: T9SS type A sorting domain-containing protein, partial [Chlorobi bacterium]|nr:T9SS type A sorting domain-containing protein [Chlorobiota bacterium]
DFQQLVTPIDSFFVNGGRFLTYFDQNRNVDRGNELIATHYINGLQAQYYSATATTLYRNVDGNIGKYFPEEIDHNFVWTLQYDDPDVKVELMNSDGNPVIISKVIKNRGLLVVSAIWQIKDDDAMKTQFNPALLGLNAISKNLLLPQLLNAIKTESNSNKFDKCILFSNSDSLIFINDAVISVNSYLSDFNSPPIFHTINLLDGEELSLPFVSENLKTYYGSGYLLQLLSDSTYGLHFERYNSEWDFIASSLSYSSLPLLENFSITSTADDGAAEVYKIIEVNPIKNDPNKPMFFIGSTSGKSKLNFSINATYNGIDNPKTSDVEFLFNHDSTKYETIIPSLLANEKLKEMFTTEPIDTAGIVALSIKYNLLTDYTALLALEPDSSIHFMKDPFDEGDLTDVDMIDEQTNYDSTFIEIYPNPFNNQASIAFNMAEKSLVDISIYNILGQKIIDLVKSEYVEGYRKYIWNGVNSSGAVTSSGIYFVILHYQEIDSNTKNMISKKILYLK